MDQKTSTSLSSYSFVHHNPIVITTDDSKLVLSLVRCAANSFQIRIQKMQPDSMEVGNDLEEAQYLLKYFTDLNDKLKANKTLITESVLKQESANDLSTLWAETEKQLELRDVLLKQSVKFYTAAKLFSEKMDQAAKFFQDLVENDITSPEVGYEIIDSHKKAKKDILEFSLNTFDESKELLGYLREMSLCSDLYGSDITTSACYTIENILESLNDRRCQLEELWQQRRQKLENCIQICFLRNEIKKTLHWVINEGAQYLEDARLGTNYQEAIELQQSHEKFEKEYHKPIHENVMKCLRTADQFIHTGLEKADQAHQEAHDLLEKWEKIALKLDQRRKLLSVVVSFYRQTEEASDRLNQLEKEIQIEHEKVKNLSGSDIDLINTTATPPPASSHHMSSVSIKINEEKPRTISPTSEIAQRQADLQSQLAEITAPCLREGRIVLEKVCENSEEAEHVIRKVYQFSEQVNELKSRLTNDIKEEINKSTENLAESKRIKDIVDFESKYNNIFSWITNVGETFLTQHRDIGKDIAYVSDYLDNHQQMESDLKENEIEYSAIQRMKDSLLKSLDDSEYDYEIQSEQIKKNIELMKFKWNKLRKSVSNRITVASNYLVFVKKLNQFRNLGLDLQELFKTASSNSTKSSGTDSVLEQRVEEKMHVFEALYHELIRTGHESISILKNSDNEVLKLNSNHLISDIEIMLNESNSLYETIKSNLEIWREKVTSRRQFKEEWQEFMVQSRRLIQKCMQTEEAFFPKMAGDLGDSLQKSEAYHQQLDEFMPTVKLITTEIEEFITKAEILALNGDTKGQKDLIINELTKIRQRFLTRINDFRTLLQKTINFYRNYNKLDEVIKEAEKLNSITQLSSVLITVENQFKKHLIDKETISKLINFTSGEGEDIVARIRQKGAETEAIEPVRNLLHLIDERRLAWEKSWEEKEKCFKRKLETIQIINEKSQINRDLDMLSNEVEHRRKNIGLNVEQVQHNVETFCEITENMNICSENIIRWRDGANKVIYLRRDDHQDAQQQQDLQESIEQIDKKWTSLHSYVNSYRNLLAKTTQLFKLMEEIEEWIAHQMQIVYKLNSNNNIYSSTESLNITKNVDEIHEFNETHIDKMKQLASEIYGESEGPSRVKHVVTKSINLLNSFIELKDKQQSAEIEPKTKKRTSQIYHESALADSESPDFSKKLESTVVLNGFKHSFECIVNEAPEMTIKWYKNGIELQNTEQTLISYDNKTGLCTLLIPEANLNDNALYSCKASNYFGMAETSAYLKVKEAVKSKGCAPLVISPLESVQLNTDSSYTLECIISGEPEPNVTWYKDSVEIDSLPEPLRSSYRQSKFINVRQLTIMNTDSDLHSGAYKCKAKNEYGEADCSCAVLIRKPMIRPVATEMNKAPIIDEPLAPTYTFKEGKKIFLTCRYTAYPRCDVIWLRDNQPIDLNLMGLSKMFKISIDMESTSLEMKEALPDDSGVYSLIIRNSLGQAKTTTQLFIKENSRDTSTTNEEARPTLLRNLKNLEVKSGSFVRLDLFVSGQPQPDILWYQNDQLIQSDDHRQFEIKENKYSLIIEECSSSDSGEYKAVLSNSFGQVHSKCRLNVLSNTLVSQPLASKPPSFVELLKDITIVSGQDVCFRCRLAPTSLDEPLPLVTWYKDGQLLKQSSKIKMASQEDNSYLVISDATNQDSGVYTASATNTNGEAKSYGRLTVSEQTITSDGHNVTSSSSSTTTTTAASNKIGGQPPEFKKLFLDRHVTPGEDVRLDAVITGSPKPKIKWLLPQDNMPQDNCRCIMAGDSYSFIITDFQERNVGRYSITAENHHGKATCSAKVLFEGTDFSEYVDDVPIEDTVAASSDAAYLEETISAIKSQTKQFSQTTTSASESKSIAIETIPVATRELSTQSAIPSATRTVDTGIQIKTDLLDQSSQMDQVKTRDESSQSEFGNVKRASAQVIESAPFVTSSEARFSSKSIEQSSNVSRSFSFQQQQHQSLAFSSSSTSGFLGAQQSTITSRPILQQQAKQSGSTDFSTTLIKDINQHYEPVELILNRSDSVHSNTGAAAISSSTYIKEVDQRHVNRFEPVNVVFPRPVYGMGRSGSLPPVVSRLNYKSSARSDFEHTDTEDDSSFYYQAENKENFSNVSYATESKLSYYKGIERKARPQFKPVELVLDASSLSDSGNKRYRDTSYPTNLQSKRIRTPVTSSFIYDQSTDYDSAASDFVSDEAVRFKHTSVRSTNISSNEDKNIKLPAMEMTIDLKAPPTIEAPLKSVHSAEGRLVKLECIVNGKPAPTIKWYKEGNEIEPNASEGIEITFETGVGLACLAIKNVAFKDAGRYTCVARNVIGSCSSSATITIQGKNEGSFAHGASRVNASVSELQQQKSTITQQQVGQLTQLQEHQYQLQLQQQQYQQQQMQQQIIEQQRLEEQQRIEFEEQQRLEQLRFQEEQYQLQLQQQQQQQYEYEQEQLLLQQQQSQRRHLTTYQEMNIFNKQQMEMTYQEIDPNRNDPQLLRSLPNYLRFSDGQPAHLEIEVSGNPAPFVTWFKNGLLIRSSPEAQISSNAGVHTLNIPEIYVEDSGVYKAVVASHLGVLESLCEITVEAVSRKASSPRSQSDSPQRRVKPEYVRYEQQQSSQMTQQQLFIQQQQQSSEHQRKLSYYSQTEVKPTQNTVQMTPTQPRAGSVSRTVSITPLQKPQFGKHLQNATFQLGKEALIQCVAKGSPDTVVKWYRNGQLLEASDAYAIDFDKSTGLCALSITEASTHDSGQYTCVATNSVGSESSTAWIVVKEPSPPPQGQQQQQQPQSQKVGARPGFQKQTTPLRLGAIESSKVEVQESSSYQQEQRSSTLDVSGKPRILEPLKDVHYVEAASASLECRIQGAQLSIQWYKNGIQLPSQFRYKMVFDEATGMARLFIATVLEDDAGEYTCRASNHFGEASTSSRLIPIEQAKRKQDDQNVQRPQAKQHRPVSREQFTPAPVDDVFESARPGFFEQPALPTPPKVVRCLQNAHYNEDETIILKALISGNPFPRCTWFKNNFPLIMSQRHSTYEEESKKLCGLKIKNAKNDDSGVYTLVIDNLYGSDDSTAHITVNVADDGRGRQRIGSSQGPQQTNQNEKLVSPKILSHLQPEVSVIEGQPIVLNCMIEGLPLPQLNFFRNDLPLSASSRFRTTFDLNSGVVTLRIDDSNVNDAGSYRIVVENLCGRTETSSVVYVNKAPIVESSNVDPEAYKNLHPEPASFVPEPILAPNFVVGLPPNYKLNEGESIQLTCQIQGSPRPSITWLKDGNSLPPSLRYNTNYIVATGNASLTVTGSLLTDCGNYTAVAENAVGKAYTTSQVVVKECKPKFGRIGSPEYESQTDEDVPLNRAKPPKVIHGLASQRVLEGQSVVLACKIDGYPKPNLIWLKDGFEVLASNRIGTQFESNTGVARLTITSAILNDAGLYAVVAENKAGSVRSDARLEVQREAGVDNQPICSGSFAILNVPPSRQAQTITPHPYEQQGYYTASEYEEEPSVPPRVIVPLKDQAVNEGSVVTMFAKIIGTPTPRILWLHDERPINESSRYTYNYEISTGIASFRINGAQVNDAGTYTAIAENRIGSVETSARLELGSVSYIDTAPIVNPDAFRYLEKPVQQPRNRISSGVDSTPIVKPDAFRYVETPRESRRSHTSDVRNAQPPKFVIPLQSIKTEEGKSISLACKVEGAPKPRVTWFKDSKPLSASTRYTPDYDLYTGIVKLHISDAQMQDGGHYMAVAENEVGHDQTECNAVIKQVPNIDRTPMVNPNAFRYLEHLPTERTPRDRVDKLTPPKVIIPLTNVKLEEGQSVVLACKIDGNPKPKLTWYKDSVVLPAANRYTTDYDLSTSVATLRIDNAQLKDLGAYVVLAENEAGSDQTTCTVFIQQVPNIDRTPMVNPDAFRYLENRSVPRGRQIDDENVNLVAPRVIVPLKDMELIEEEPVLLICKIEGKPRPKLTWFKDSKPLTASNRYETDYNLSTNVATLKISNTLKNDLGNYLVLAENSAGKDQTFCKLYIKSSPNIDETPMVNPESFKFLDEPPIAKSTEDADYDRDKYFPPYIIIPLSNLNLNEGNDVRLACKIDGYPKPKLTWYKNNEPLMASQRYDIEHNLSTGVCSLNIKQTKALDIGIYRLTVENLMGRADTSCQLFIKTSPNIDETAYVNPNSFRILEMPPKQAKPQTEDIVGEIQPALIVKQLQDQECYEGEIATFICEVKGNPKPTVSWTHEGAPLNAAQRVAFNYLINEGKAICVISNAKTSDLGRYTLTARNKAGEATSSANLKVNLVPTIDDTSYVNPDVFQQFETPGQQPTAISDEQYKKPYFVKIPKNVEIREAAVLRLDCLAFGRPFPTLTWYFNGTEFFQDSNHKVLINEEAVNSVLIPVANFADSGIYSCVARNKAGEASFNVEVKVVDKDAMVAPFFIEHLKNAQFIPEGQDAILSCTCSGTPVPSVTWQKDVQTLTPDVEYRIDTNGGHSRLHVSCALKEDDGWFTCTATNPAGTAITRCRINIIPQGQPNTVAPDLSKLNKTPQDLIDVPGFVNTLTGLKNVLTSQSGVSKYPQELFLNQTFGSIWSKDELEDQETMYNKDRPIPPKFKTHFRAQLNLRERQPARFFAKLIPIGDPTMKIQWFRNGEPLRSATRYEIKYDFGLVSLDLLWSYPEDDGIYECIATNEAGQDRTKAELKCKANRSIIYDTQLPEGLEGHYKLQEIEDKHKLAALVKEEPQEEQQPEPYAPEIVLKLENQTVDEGGLVKFMAKITGYPKPRINWFVNDTHAINGSKFKLYFDGMIHYMDIPKTVKAEHEGVIRCFAKNMVGQCETTCRLKINPKLDYRSFLKNRSNDADEIFYAPVVRTEQRMTTPERKLMERVSALAPSSLRSKTHADNRVTPKFTKELEPLSNPEGTSIDLSVEFTGVPAPEVFWYKDGLQMESSIDFHIESTVNKSTLKIREGFKSDSGIYQVKLFNEIGVAQTKAYLGIIPAHLKDMTPTILLNLKSLKVNSGDPVKFQTQAKGDPAPVLTWFKDDEPLVVSERVKEFVQDGIHTLLIMESIAADSGCYECVAENTHGKTYTRAYLNVIGNISEPAEAQVVDGAKPLSSKHTQPSVEVSLTDQTAKEGSSVKFECTILHSTFADHAHIYWYKEDKVIKQSKYFSMESNDTTHCLDILEAFPEDEGHYKCMVKNPAGSVSTTAYLKIEQTAQVPEFIKTLNDTEADENMDVELSAQFKPDPLTHIEWSREGLVIKEDDLHEIKTSPETGFATLTIREAKPKDGGIYTCRAYNSAGTVNCSANLNVRSMKQLKLMKLSGVLSGDKSPKKEKTPAKKAEIAPAKKATGTKEKPKASSAASVSTSEAAADVVSQAPETAAAE